MSSTSRDSISEIIHESGDASEQRLRSFKGMQEAIHQYEPELRKKVKNYQSYHKEFTMGLEQLTQQRSALQVGSSQRKSKKLKNLEPKIRRQEKAVRNAKSDVDTGFGQLDSIRTAKSEMNIPTVDKAVQDWVLDDQVQSVNVRTLAGWSSHGKPWLDRNVQAGRTPQKGEVLDVNEGWTDFVNQGWMQGGYDRGAAFRLLTPVSQDVVRMQNGALKSGDWKKFESDMTRHAIHHGDQSLWHAGNDRRTFYGQELVDLTRHQYAIHTDQSGRQVAMPKAKSDLLNEIRSKVTLK